MVAGPRWCDDPRLEARPTRLWVPDAGWLLPQATGPNPARHHLIRADSNDLPHTSIPPQHLLVRSSALRTNLPSESPIALAHHVGREGRLPGGCQQALQVCYWYVSARKALREKWPDGSEANKYVAAGTPTSSTPESAPSPRGQNP